LKESGRSTLSIVELANKLVEWTENQDRVPKVSDALQHPPLIELTPENDPQPNPVDEPDQVHLIYTKFSAQDEIRAVADSLERWIPDNDNKTVAVLVPRNYRGFEIVDELRRRGIDYVDGLLQSSSSTRFSAGVLGNLLQYLSDPQSSKKLARVYEVWRRAEREDKTAWAEVGRTGERIRKIQRVEDFIWPEPGYDMIDEFLDEGLNIEVCESLKQFRDLVRRWQSAVLLPVDQIVLTVAQELMSEPVELALAQKLAVVLKQAARTNPSWRLPELTAELSVIARNERRFIGFSADDSGFDPDKYKGKVVVSTMHKAKGLEWDRVYLMSVNSYNFPFYEENDTYIAEKWFIRNRLNLQAETLEQLDIAISTDEYAWYEEGLATDKARLDYVRERLRLFYVGITRARRQLIVTWNTGRAGKLGPSVPFLSLDERIDSLPNILGGEK
jgi:DNA helicase-2/ATP-dependent DNA helicase PcrA